MGRLSESRLPRLVVRTFMIEQELIPMHNCTCELCGHKWCSKGIPLRCAKCKRVEWNRRPKQEIVYQADPESSIAGWKDPPVSTTTSGSGAIHSETCTCILCLLTKGKR